MAKGGGLGGHQTCADHDVGLDVLVRRIDAIHDRAVVQG